MDVFHFGDFVKLKHVHHTKISMGKFLSSEKVDSVITHLLVVMVIMEILVQIKDNNAPAYVYRKTKGFCILQHKVYYSYVIQPYRTRCYRKF